VIDGFPHPVNCGFTGIISKWAFAKHPDLYAAQQIVPHLSTTRIWKQRGYAQKTVCMHIRCALPGCVLFSGAGPKSGTGAANANPARAKPLPNPYEYCIFIGYPQFVLTF
jgi:hypothetical protein